MDPLLSLLLAQSADSAQQGVGILQSVLSGGVPLICLVIAVLCGTLFYLQLKRNALLEKDLREKIEALLREMLDRDREATETTTAAIQAVESYSHALKEQQTAFTAMKLSDENQARELRELREKVGSLEETVRRPRDA